jgi:hypothetical protein
MGQSASSADLKAACAQSCKEWGDKDLSTVKVDLASIRPALEALCNDCNDNSVCPGSGVDAGKALQKKDKELVTDQENVPPNGFKAPNHTHQSDQNDDVSTVASTAPSVRGNQSEVKVPQLSLPNQGTSPRPPLQNAQVNGHDMQTVEAADSAMPQMQPMAPEAWVTEKGSVPLELKIVLMEWSESQRGLCPQEVITIPSTSGVHSDLKVADFKTLLRDQNLTLKSGKLLDTDFKVLTTPRRLEMGVTLNGLKTLAESNIRPEGPELLLLDTESLRKANSANNRPSPRNVTFDPQLEVEKKEAEVEQNKPSPKPRSDEEHKVLIEQQLKVESWLKSTGFKDVNELARKQLLTKTRPLHVAVQKGEDEMIRLLILMGADPHLCNGKKETPLAFAKRLSREKGALSASTYLKVASALDRTQDLMINQGFG